MSAAPMSFHDCAADGIPSAFGEARTLFHQALTAKSILSKMGCHCTVRFTVKVIKFIRAEESIVAQIEFRKVSKSFGKIKVIENLDLVIPDGKFTVLVGPSGCGKTTLLRMIAGIGLATSGQILMDGTDITDMDPGKRDVAMVFQNYAIYPTMSVLENIEFGLKNQKIPKDERSRRIQEVVSSVGLLEYLDRKPSTLSGGQRQRIALARAMVKHPQVFLMDEPLSNLDAKLRTSMRTELIELHERLKATFVYVTHDQIEAMAMADQIVLMFDGRIMQQGSPEVIYRDPDNVFAAQFIGTPAMNVFPVGNEGIQLGYRPEKAVLTAEKTNHRYSCKGVVHTREMLGSETIYKVQLSNRYVMVKSADDHFHIADHCYLSVNDKDLYFFDKDGQRIRQPNDNRVNDLMSMAGGSCDV